MPALARHADSTAWMTVAAIFVAGLPLPAGYTTNNLFVLSILLAIFARDSRLAFRLAGASTLAVLLNLYFVPPGVSAGATVFTRGTLIATLWLTALAVVGYRRTVAARSEAEQALRASAKDLEDITRALDQSAIVATTDVQGTITYVNDKFCEISKYSREELIGRNHRILNSGLHSLDFFKQMYRTIGHGRVWRGELRNRAKDGSLYWVDTTIVPFIDEDGRPYRYIAIRYDITERKQSEAALRAQTSLVQLGKMAAIVAHEVRNPLAGIRGAIQVIGRRLPTGTAEHAIAHEVVTRIDTLNDIVQDLLLFARPRPPVPVTVPVKTLIDDTISLLKEDPRFAAVDIRVDATGAPVAADPEQLKLVLLNLLINSAQAMEGAGQIAVSAREIGRWMELRVADQGPGIPPDIREHLFEPFFTTKHRGTGLGLATARRILEGHGGTIALDCPPEGGTVALIRLPR
jgi:two-component system CheB/CheR fusion protein